MGTIKTIGTLSIITHKKKSHIDFKFDVMFNLLAGNSFFWGIVQKNRLLHIYCTGVCSGSFTHYSISMQIKQNKSKIIILSLPQCISTARVHRSSVVCLVDSYYPGGNDKPPIISNFFGRQKK